MIDHATGGGKLPDTHINGLRLIAFSIAGLAIGGVQTAVVIYLPAFYARFS